MTNQPLLDFVRNQLQLGLNKDTITSMLLGQGWSVADVNEAFATISAGGPVQMSSVPIPPSSPTSGYVIQPQQSQQLRKKAFSSIFLIVIVFLCCIAGGVFAYYKFVPLTPSQIFENALRATIGHTESFAFESTTTGSVATAQASAYSLPSTANFSFAGSGSVDFHSRPDPLVDLNLALNAESSSSEYNGSVQVSLDTLYAEHALYVNLHNFNISVQTPSSQEQAASFIPIINAFAQRVENQWIVIPTASSTIQSMSTSSNIQSQISEIDNYIFGMSYVKSASNLGKELINGTETYHLNVTLQDDGQLAALIKNISIQQQPSLATSTEFATQMNNLSQTLSQQINVDIWIGTSDFRVYRVVAGPLSFSDSQSGTVSTSSYQTDFSEYGQAMNIVPPANSITIQQLLQNLFGSSSTTSGGYSNQSEQSSQVLSASDIVALKNTVQSFTQAFLSGNEQEVLQYSSAASQGTLNINQLNTAFKSLTIKNISGVSTQAEVVMTAVTDSGTTENIVWGFIKENGAWKFDLGMTEELSRQI